MHRRQALHAIEEQSRKDHEAKVKAEAKVRSRRPTSVPSLQYESSPGEEVVGGFFFDIGAVRTDLTEMLRAGSSAAATRSNMLGDERGGHHLPRTGASRSRS